MKIHITKVPEIADTVGNRAPEEAEPETLCENWVLGCNGVTEGPDSKGYLTLCYDGNSARILLLSQAR